MAVSECGQALSATREPAQGDIVTLASGGPDLTVLRVYSDVDGIVGRVADLGWLTAAGEYRTGTLPLAVLRMKGGAERESAAPRKPPRTGYRDLDTGTYHPGPSYVGFDAHADRCRSCAALRLIADDYIDRRIDQHIAEALRRAHADLPGT